MSNRRSLEICEQQLGKIVHRNGLEKFATVIEKDEVSQQKH